jgi:4-amino-4-deoxy-L-arabinose transferase-like glycosyltransferase
MEFLAKLSRVRGIGWYVGVAGTGISLLFTFLVYPRIGDVQHAVLDPDLHGPLGFGIWKFHTFSYYPNPSPASDRGPLYPAMIATLLAITNGWWPYSVQLAQCVLFGLMCVLTFWVAQRLWNRSLAVLASGLCALNPFLIWYTSRILVESLMLLLFTGLIASVVLLKHRPGPWSALLVGVIIGLCVLTKSVYTPFLVLTPVLLLLPFGERVAPGLAAIVLVSGILVVMPWSFRNYQVTGVFAPVVGRSGFTLHQGNDFVEDFARAPFSISALYPLSLERMRSENDLSEFSSTPGGVRRSIALDAAHGRSAIGKFLESPEFFFKKVTYDLFLFWTLGDSPGKSLAIALVQLPVVVLFCTFLIRRRGEIAKGAVGICVCLVILYYFAHLPTIALARYSVVLVPAMLIVAVGLFEPYSRRSPG